MNGCHVLRIDLGAPFFLSHRFFYNEIRAAEDPPRRVRSGCASSRLRYLKTLALVLGTFLYSFRMRAGEANAVSLGSASHVLTNAPQTVLVHGGTFMMGTRVKSKRDPMYHADEAPLRVTVEAFRIGKFPVTAEQMCAFLNSPAAKEHKAEGLYLHKDMIAVGSGTPLTYSTITVQDGIYVPRPKAAQSPANLVTWKGAVLFCNWLSKRTGKTYRLPSEAEWEWAARGKELREWPWGEGPPTAAHGRRYDYTEAYNSDQLAERHEKNLPMWSTTPVGSNPETATPEGVCDMLTYCIGEWCANKYIAKLTPQQATNTIADLGDLKTQRVVRGGLKRGASKRGGLLEGLIWFNFHYPAPHMGVTWTRLHAHPLNAPKQAAWYGFRVVEIIQESRGL